MDHQPVADSTNNGPAAGSSKHTSYASMLAHAVDDVGHAVSEFCNLPATFAEIAPAGEAGVSSDELDWELVGNAAAYSTSRTAQHTMHVDVAWRVQIRDDPQAN
jgi:hypothetical protein